MTEKTNKNKNKSSRLRLTEAEIKRVDAVAEFKANPLEPFVKLDQFLRQAFRDAVDEKGNPTPTLTFDREALLAAMPKRPDFGMLAMMLPAAINAKMHSASNDYDFNLYDHGSDYGGGTDTITDNIDNSDDDQNFPDQDHYAGSDS